MVPADSDRITRVPPYSGYYLIFNFYVYGPITLYGVAFQKLPLEVKYRMIVLQPSDSRNYQNLGCFPFARHYSGNHICFLFLRLLRCFSSPGWHSDYSEYPAFNGISCLIRKSSDHGIFAPPRSLSQLVTSFIASESQGILHTLLITFFVVTQYLFLQFLPVCQRTQLN